MSEGENDLRLWAGWLAAGLAGVGLVWMTYFAIDTGFDWPTAGWLVLALVVTGVTFALSSVPLAGLLVPLSRSAEPWRWSPSLSPVRIALGIAAGVTIGWAMLVEHAAGAGRVGWGVGVPWLAGMLLAGLCAWWPNIGRPEWTHRAAWTLPGVVAWLGVAGVALGTRLVWPGQFPSIVDGDEAVFLHMARDARSGEMANPWATGWLEVPNLYPAAMGWLSHLTGDSLAGYRLLMALVGATTVLATWRLGRVVVGPEAALVGGLVLAVMPMHLFFTRTALFHGTDPAALMLGLLFLHRAVRSDRSGDAWLAGVMVGLGWYGYWGARSLPLTIALMLLLTARPLWRVATLGLWASIGFLVTIAPLVVTYLRYPPAFSGRLEVTSISTTGDWVTDPVQAVLSRLKDAAFMPFLGNYVVFYLHDPPLPGWPEALLLLFGGSRIAGGAPAHAYLASGGLAGSAGTGADRGAGSGRRGGAAPAADGDADLGVGDGCRSDHSGPLAGRGAIGVLAPAASRSSGDGGIRCGAGGAQPAVGVLERPDRGQLGRCANRCGLGPGLAAGRRASTGRRAGGATLRPGLFQPRVRVRGAHRDDDRNHRSRPRCRRSPATDAGLLAGVGTGTVAGAVRHRSCITGSPGV